MADLTNPRNGHGTILAEKILAFSKNLDNLRDFVQVVGSVLDQRQQLDFEKDPESLMAHLLAFHTLREDELLLSPEQLEIVKRACDGKFEIEVIDRADGKGPSARIKSVTGEDGRIREAAETIIRAVKRKANLYSSSLMSLMSEGEWFCAQLLHYYFAKHPEAVGLKERNFSFDELVKFSSIEDAKKYLVDNRVEDILRGSFSDWIDFFKEKMKISIGAFGAHLPHAQEASLRRNLLVHNGGEVNQIYLNKLPVELDERPLLGSQISVSPEYFADRIDRFEIIFQILALEIWGKFSKDDAARGAMATNLGFEALQKERYAVAEALCLYGVKDKNLASDVKANAQVNFWQSLKWRGRQSEVQSEIERWDVSALDLQYKAAKFALLDDWERGIPAVRAAVRAERLSIDDLRIWPLFKAWRVEGRLSEFIVAGDGGKENGIAEIPGQQDDCVTLNA